MNIYGLNFSDAGEPRNPRGLHGPYLKVFPLVTNKCAYRAQQSWISFFIGTSPSGITREALNIFLFLLLKKIVEKKQENNL